MLKQMRLNVPELVTIHMDQLSAGFADTMKMSGALLIFRVRITCAFARTENIFPYASVFNKPFQLAVNRRCANGLVFRSEAVSDLCSSKMLSGCIFQEVQQLFPGPCPVGCSLSHETLLLVKSENCSQLYADKQPLSTFDPSEDLIPDHQI
jgi:hypothetical protein